ncbi:putative transcriptional regulator, TetR family [Candidatus Nitrososphaera gargensis Ga9.2]|uniref:Putative transcriptional regulator, TetR family n=1 Tax=Nitrososphaera gargensis (strain Ga9.2) TaxID=1237085 RepID=K0IES4_NITGG|nr:TetR/AcrR family transcriptional regulator [Candidatus Nitrososphaera gargensis]AFU58260.1 putative transcriptional regulator, TetR family [Candidatus Nitrososphaera gargensis Ga9.2]
MPKVTSMYKAEVKEKIIRAAIDSFAQTGFDRTKMEDIAKRLGLSKGTIYLYFKSKEDLFLAICEHNMQQSDREDAGLFVRKDNIASDAEQIYDNIRRREQGNDRVMLEMVAESARNPKLKKAMYELHVKVHEHVMQAVKSKIDEGFLRKDVDAASLAIALVALYDGLAVNRMLGISDAVNKKAWVTMIKTMIAGSS